MVYLTLLDLQPDFLKLKNRIKYNEKVQNHLILLITKYYSLMLKCL